MSVVRFLVSLGKVNSAEKILVVTSDRKENLNFSEEDVYSPKRQVLEMVSKIKDEISNLLTELLEIKISDDIKEVALMIAGYIAKKLSKRKACAVCKVKTITDETSIKYDKHLRTLSCGKLICPLSPIPPPSPSIKSFCISILWNTRLPNAKYIS